MDIFNAFTSTFIFTMFLGYCFDQNKWLIKNKYLTKQITPMLVRTNKLHQKGLVFVWCNLLTRISIFFVAGWAFNVMTSDIEIWRNTVAVGFIIVSVILLTHIMIKSSIMKVYVPLALKYRLINKGEPK